MMRRMGRSVIPKRSAISRAAPGGNQNVGIFMTHGVWIVLASGLANWFSSCSFDQLRDPRLRCNDRLSPFFAKHSETRETARSRAYGLYLTLHASHNFFATILDAKQRCNHRDIGVDVFESVGRKAKESDPGLQYLGHGFFLIGN